MPHHGTVRDADARKAGAGISTRGRKLKNPYEHVTLSWSPKEPAPSRDQMMGAAHEALKVRGVRPSSRATTTANIRTSTS